MSYEDAYEVINLCELALRYKLEQSKLIDSNTSLKTEDVGTISVIIYSKLIYVQVPLISDIITAYDVTQNPKVNKGFTEKYKLFIPNGSACGSSKFGRALARYQIYQDIP
jgi:hypothetical protein